ncbi:alpha/beta hydrolase-fold protein [uncultured Draconibacterium sp.]|uniref:alpha/beta hydrolase n=1 Tax=uncultured Draconibacterium sp. TaxID=1573823 RepID=UPI002AA70CBD|nr:alpha/beta hydrolase-fold protein [uncultured Draconibacterium sp.]
MKKLTLLTSLILSSIILFSQEIKLGFIDSINSKVLNENRRIMIKLPKGYAETEKSYPVIYRLDGDIDLFSETIGTINRLAYIDELIPEMIVVMIENTDRNRDMMPTKTGFFNTEPGAEKFKNFFDYELVPFINKSFRTTNEKILCGQSLSAIFTLYHFLTNTNAFNSYIVCSGAFLDCGEYFNDLTTNFLKTKENKQTRIFLTHGLKDFLDTDGINGKQLSDFSQKINSKENVVSELKVYKDEGHVPFQSLYHGLKFIYTSDK